MYEIVLSESFRKELIKAVKGNDVLWRKVTKTLNFLSSDIKHPSLRLHKLTGRNNWSISISKSYRMIIQIDKNKILCNEFGTHDQVY
jgi:mRNA-degrading endonuclease YafQ of YafQ-DinJ toxin-antitoxin module